MPLKDLVALLHLVPQILRVQNLGQIIPTFRLIQQGKTAEDKVNLILKVFQGMETVLFEALQGNLSYFFPLRINDLEELMICSHCYYFA